MEHKDEEDETFQQEDYETLEQNTAPFEEPLTPLRRSAVSSPEQSTPHGFGTGTPGGTPGGTPAQSPAGTPHSQRSNLSGFSQQNYTPLGSQRRSVPASPAVSTPFGGNRAAPGSLPRGDLGRGPVRTSRYVAPPTPTGYDSLLGDANDDSLSEIDNQEYLNNHNRHDAMDEEAENTVFIWGTAVSVKQSMLRFRTFINSFYQEGDENVPFYHKELHVLRRSGMFILNLNCAHLKEWPGTKDFYKQMIQYPNETVPIMDTVINETFVELFGEPEVNRQIQVRTYNLSEQSRMRDLDPNDIDKLLTVKGMVIRCSSIIPDLKQAFFRCFVCGFSSAVFIDAQKRIDEPPRCTACNKLASMELIHNRCLFTDKQMIRLQETPDEIPEGETPYTITMFAYDDLVDSVRPGDRIEVTGIFKAIARRPNPKMRTVKSIFKTYIDAHHFRRANTGEDKMISGDEGIKVADVEDDENTFPQDLQGGSSNKDMNATKQFSAKRIEDFHAFVATGNTYDRLVKSFAPSIWEMDDVKRGLLCLLFGGTIRRKKNKNQDRASNKRKGDHRQYGDEGLGLDLMDQEDNEAEESDDEEDSNAVHQRGDINILLCGDPGTSKSQLLSYVHKITPRGIYTSGKGSSAVGLTASVVRDPETRDMVLESGALVLSDNGICCIDEFDKMSDQTRAILHEAMEQQTVSITKAGIIATLNARTSILASANPVESRYNARLSVVENIKLPPTLLSRFDLIYLILDKPNKDSDRRLATHLVSLYHTIDEEEVIPDATELHYNIRNPKAIVDQKFLKDFISYARNNMCPEISDEAEQVLVDSYLAMRALGGRGLKTITATPRQLESLIRISQALAKMRLCEVVTAEDVHEATRLMRVATQAAATDPRTGTIDMDMISTGRSTLDRDLVMKLVDELREQFSHQKGHRYTVQQIRQIILKNMNGDNNQNNSRENSDRIHSVSLAEVEDAVRELQQEGVVIYNDTTQTVSVRG